MTDDRLFLATFLLLLLALAGVMFAWRRAAARADRAETARERAERRAYRAAMDARRWQAALAAAQADARRSAAEAAHFAALPRDMSPVDRFIADVLRDGR